MMASSRADLPIGRIVGVHGMKGYVKVHSYDGSSDLFAVGARLTIRMKNGEVRTQTVVDCRPHQRGLRMAFDGVTDRSGADALAGAEILIPRASLPEPEPGTWYWCDLIGLTVLDTRGQRLGTIANLFETGGNDVMVVRLGTDERLIPVLKSIVRGVDLEEKTMVVDLPEGL